jgi:predicted ester cyclase
MSEENQSTIRRFVEDAFNGRDLSVLDEIVAEGFTNHDPPFHGLSPGREGLKQTFGGFWSAFPDIEATSEQLIADEDKVALVVSLRGTHRGELMGIPPTETEMSIRTVEIFHLVARQIAERWGVVDRAALMKQLGALPGGARTESVASDA